MEASFAGVLTPRFGGGAWWCVFWGKGCRGARAFGGQGVAGWRPIGAVASRLEAHRPREAWPHPNEIRRAGPKVRWCAARVRPARRTCRRSPHVPGFVPRSKRGKFFMPRARASSLCPAYPQAQGGGGCPAPAWRPGASMRPARPCPCGPSRAGCGPFAARGGGWVGRSRRCCFVGVCRGCFPFCGSRASGAVRGSASGGWCAAFGAGWVVGGVAGWFGGSGACGPGRSACSGSGGVGGGALIGRRVGWLRSPGPSVGA